MYMCIYYVYIYTYTHALHIPHIYIYIYIYIYRERERGSRVRKSYASTLRPVVVCPYLCTSETFVTGPMKARAQNTSGLDNNISNDNGNE